MGECNCEAAKLLRSVTIRTIEHKMSVWYSPVYNDIAEVTISYYAEEFWVQGKRHPSVHRNKNEMIEEGYVRIGEL